MNLASRISVDTVLTLHHAPTDDAERLELNQRYEILQTPALPLSYTHADRIARISVL